MNMSDPIVVKGVVEAAKSLIAPAYTDAVQPAAKEIGRALETVAKCVNIALVPLAALVWGYEQTADYLNRRLSEKLAGTPPERITTPPANVAGPAVEAMRFTAQTEELREMYASLLATAMDSETATSAHPAFVEIIKQITQDEARILKHLENMHSHPIIDVKAAAKSGTEYTVAARRVSMIAADAGIAHGTLMGSYLDNLERLGVIEVPYGKYLSAPGAYDRLEGNEALLGLKAQIEEAGRNVEFDRSYVGLTSLGRQFVDACVRARPGEIPRNNA